MLVAAVVTVATVVAACGEDEPAARERGSEQELRTEDGYEVVTAPGSPRTAAKRAPTKARDPRRENLILEPNAPDPEGGEFTLEEAVADMPVDGQLVAELATDLGTLFCDLYADRVPNTVAAFIGLARGKRAWWNPESGQWETRPYYTRTDFHRVIPDYLIQAGDRLDDGTGDVGFEIPLEQHETLRFDRPAMLGMVTGSGEEGGAGQFFITDGPAPQLDGKYTVFGRCQPPEVVNRIARVPQGGGPEHSPLSDVIISRVFIQRVAGGAQNARMTMPAVRPEQVGEARGASQPPGQAQREIEERRRLREEMQRGQ